MLAKVLAVRLFDFMERKPMIFFVKSKAYTYHIYMLITILVCLYSLDMFSFCLLRDIFENVIIFICIRSVWRYSNEAKTATESRLANCFTGSY